MNSEPEFQVHTDKIHGSVLLWTGIALVLVRLLASIVLPIYDDAFITFRYARNLAVGRGLVYHPDEWVLGTTSPGYSLYATVLYLTGLPFPTTAVAANIALDSLILYVTFLAVGGPERRLACVLFGNLFAVSPIMSRICVGGMEMNLFLAWSISAIMFYHRGHKRAAITLAALSYFLRPEGVILVGLLCLGEWLGKSREGAVRLALTAVLAVLPPLFCIYKAYGHIIPQSVVAKSRDLGTPLAVVLEQLVFSDPLCLVLAPLALWGLVLAFRRGGFQRTVGLWSLGYLSAYLIARPKVWSWYGEPIHYGVTLLGAMGIGDLLQRVPRLAVSLPKTWTAGIGSAAVVILWIALLAKLGPSSISKHVYGGMERWCREHVSEGTSILAGDIGAIGYYSNARIYDVAGLVWPDALNFGSVADMIQAYKPDFILLTADRSSVDLMQSDALRKLYRAVAAFSPTGDSRVDLEQEFPERWVQSYLMFERIP